MRELEVESGEPIWDLVAEFLERRERGEPIDTEAFIGAHPELAERLRQALAGFEWMETKARPGHASMGEVLPRSFGNYELLRVIGRGGMGCVYEAFHRPLKRHVAIKVLPPHLTNVREFRLRFLREARVIASLHHTHIAPVFEVGQIESTLYLAMPFIAGPNLRELTLPIPGEQPAITKELRSRLPSPLSQNYFRWVADIGVQAADALAHAHAHGVIHRDVKPSNLLIDEHGQIWMVDFGLAKAPTHPTVTLPGELIGTLRYASPEQVMGEPFDKRSDIYSLGVTLYEILTRRPAFPPGPGKQIIGSEPMRPRRVNPRIPRDLETIIIRSMAKRPSDRYATADAMADDLRRFLRDEPIRARPISWFGRMVRWSRRNPALSGVSAAAAVLLAGFAAFHLMREAEHRATQNIEAGISNERYVSYLKASAANVIDSGQPGRTRLALDLISEAAKLDFREGYWELAIRAIDQVDIGAPIDLPQSDRALESVAVSPDGQLIVGVEPSGRLAFWDASGGRVWLSSGFGESINSLIWSPDGLRIAASSPKHVWIARVDRLNHALDDIRAIAYQSAALAFQPSGRTLAVWGNTIGLWDVTQGQFLWERPSQRGESGRPGPPAYRFLAWSPDGSLFAAVPADEATVEFWNMPAGEPTIPAIGIVVEELNPRMAARTLGCVTFAANGSQIACGCADGSTRFYDCMTGGWERTLQGHETPVRWLRMFSRLTPAAGSTAPPPDWLISADEQDVRLWDLRRDQPVAVLARNLEGHRSASIDSRGTILAVVDGSSQVHAWRMPDLGRHQVVAPEPRRVTAIAASQRDRRIAWADERGHVTIGDADMRRVRIEIESGLENVQLAFNPAGNILALGGDGESPIRLVTIETGEMRPLATGRSAVRAIAFINGGQRLATIHDDGRLIVWNIDTGSPFATVDSGQLLSLCVSRDGKWLAAGSPTGNVHLWNTESMTRTLVSAAHPSEVLALAFTPDGQTLASASRDGLICRWRVPNLAREFCFEGPGGPIRDMTFCLGGSTLATCGGDGRVILWVGDRPTRIGALAGRATGRFDRLTTTGDGDTLIAAGGAKQITVSTPGGLELWNLAAIQRAVVEAQLPDWRVPLSVNEKSPAN